VLVFSLLSCASSGPVKEPSDGEINAQAAKAYTEVKARNQRSTNAAWNALVQRVATRIEVASGEHFQWEAILLENPEVNAWCMPGGKIAVYTGIMPVLKTEAALAAVLGHEVAHATMRHGRKQYARAMNENLLGLAVAGAAIIGGQLFCKSSSCKLLTGLGGAVGGFAITFFDRKFSRADESEADRVGQMYMAKAGYDPSESIKLWERMTAAMGGKAPPQWMSTQPSDEHRRAAHAADLPQAMAAYHSAPSRYGLGEPVR
jgi:predicted Zn-dependent protease